MATDLILIRHGNAVRVNGDYVHAPLTSLGEQQAARTGQFLAEQPQRIDYLYASPLLRAKETATIIGSKFSQTPEIKNDIRELEALEVPPLALLEALSIFDFVEDYLERNAAKPIRWPVEGRVSRALMEIVAAHPNQQVAVVAHSGVISATLAWIFSDQRLHWWMTMVGNCSLTRLRVDAAHIEVLAINETNHLAPAEATVQPPAPAVQVTKQVLQTVKRPTPAPKS